MNTLFKCHKTTKQLYKRLQRLHLKGFINIVLFSELPVEDNESESEQEGESNETSIRKGEEEDVDDIEEEVNETSLLCPTSSQNEIIISPSTLNYTSKLDAGTEDIYMRNFKGSHSKRYKDF